MKRRTRDWDKNRGPRKGARFAYQNRPRQGIPATLRPSSEIKYFDTELENKTLIECGTGFASSHSLDPTTGGTRGTLFYPKLGNDINNRIGKKVRILSIRMNGVLRYTQTTGLSSIAGDSNCRIVLVVNKQTNGITAAPGEVIQSGPTTTVGGMNQFQNLNYLGKYRVLKDKRFVVSDPQYIGTTGAGTVDNSGTIRNFKLSHKFRKPFIVHFNSGTAETVADVVQNSLHLFGGVHFTDIEMTISYKCRVSYMDM